MKKALLASFGVMIAATLFAPSALAKDFSKLHINSSTNINKDCSQPDGYDPVWACYSQESKSGGTVGTIYIREDIPNALLPYVFFRNVGQFLISDLSQAELEAVFHPVPQLRQVWDIRDIAGNAFAFWMSGGRLTNDQEQLFRKLLSN